MLRHQPALEILTEIEHRPHNQWLYRLSEPLLDIIIDPHSFLPLFKEQLLQNLLNAQQK
jgi:hypothetical protein